MRGGWRCTDVRGCGRSSAAVEPPRGAPSHGTTHNGGHLRGGRRLWYEPWLLLLLLLLLSLILGGGVCVLGLPGYPQTFTPVCNHFFSLLMD